VPIKERQYSGGRPVPGYSRDKNNQPVSDEQIKEWLSELIAGEENAYGYRKLTICLKRQYHLIINKKKVYRLCKELDILAPQRQLKLKYPRRIACNRLITSSNELWEIDIKYGYIAGETRFFYLMCVIDVYDRMIIDYHIGLSCEGRHAAQLVQRGLWKRKLFTQEVRPTIRTDNGPQFVSHVFEDACETLEAEHERIPPSTPNKNAHIESFHSVLQRESLGKNEFMTYQEAYKTVTDYIQFYNQRRIHGSLYDLAPVEFIQQLADHQIQSIVVKV
jgi:putative transposase